MISQVWGLYTASNNLGLNMTSTITVILTTGSITTPVYSDDPPAHDIGQLAMNYFLGIVASTGQ